MSIHLHPDQTIETFLARYPEVGGYLITQRMLCVGCLFAHFHTLRDIADIYHLDLETFLTNLAAQTEAHLGRDEGLSRDRDCPYWETRYDD